MFPRLVSSEYKAGFKRDLLASENTQLSALLGGGIERGSSVLALGPPGAGKSILALTFIANAIKRGEKAAIFLFDEEIGLLIERSKGVNLHIDKMLDTGRLTLQRVDVAELSPGEFAQRVRDCILGGARMIVIDSLNGYQASMPNENAILLYMHELLQFANRQGATTFLTVAQHGLVGEMKSPVDLTYLADTVVLLRYFEALGRVRRAISVVKKRTSNHEDTIREYMIDGRGLTLGEPLKNFHGVLRGVLTLVGDKDNLLKSTAT